MKVWAHILTVAAVILFVATDAAIGQNDVIALFSDIDRSSCGVEWPMDFPVYIYVFHYAQPAGATGSRFSLPRPLGPTGNISDPLFYSWQYPWTGTIQGGLEFSYGSCLDGWIFLCIIYYWDCCGLGGWGQCCAQTVEPHDSSLTGQIETLDCEGIAHPAIGRSWIGDMVDSCLCVVPTGIQYHPTTWGSIKGMYSEEPP
jgi:hypothetical protein